MRGRTLAGLIIVLGSLTASPSPAVAAGCAGAECGVPHCWDADVNVRPGMTRALRVSCWNATGAKLLQAPERGHITDVSTDGYGLKFTVRYEEDVSWMGDRAVFEVQGPEGKIDLPVLIRVIPPSENSPPVCVGDHKSQRSDGNGPVDLFMHPRCHDPERDEFTMYGGGPGVHPESPKAVPAGSGESNWTYRTATASGSETTTVWAVDSLGARSADAQLEVTVGPDIDRLPDCMPGMAHFDGSGVFPIYTRPGRIRRFGILCSDPDGDPLVTAVSALPARGTLAFVPGRVWVSSYWGYEQWNDGTYLPADESMEPDEFTLTSAGAHGAGPSQRMALVPRPPTVNYGGGCGWSPANVVTGTAGAVELSCSDQDGDPLSVEVIGGPLHGTTGTPVLTPGLYGETKGTIPYVPDPGYEGYDCVKLRVSDGYGHESEISVDINVAKAAELPPDLPLPEIPPLPIPLPPVEGVSLEPVAPGAPPPPLPADYPAIVKTYAQDLFRTTEVARIAAPGDTQIFAPPALSKAELLRNGRAAGIFVVCPRACRIRSATRLLTGSRRRVPSRRTATSAAAGQGQLIWLDLDRRQRAALKRAASPRAAFQVTVRAEGSPARSFRRSIRIAR